MNNLVVRPNKPILFSVDHELDIVSKRMPQFVELIKGKKILFIEGPPEAYKAGPDGKYPQFGSSAAAYQSLALEAKKAGLIVIALDNSLHAKKSLVPRGEVRGPITGAYLGLNKREKAWLQKIEGHGSSAVLTMHPGHASVIARTMNLPNENVFGELQYPLVRPLANREFSEIERVRLERRKAKAIKRLRMLEARKARP